MRIDSFIDIISTDGQYDTYKFVKLNTYNDMMSGDPMEHVCMIDHQLKLEAPADSLEKVQEFRTRVTNELGGIKNVIIIDLNRGKIFSDIKNDSFFERLIKNVEYSHKLINENSSLEKIIKKAFPDPLPSKNQRTCTLL